jgi:ketosteroid isomerase-like protein
MNKLIVCVLFVLTPAAPAQTPVKTDEATAAITQLREGLVSSFQKGEIDRLLTYLDPDVLVTWQNGEICRGPEAVRTFYARMMKGDKPIVRAIASEPEVLGRHVYGDWAVSWGNLHDHFILSDGSDLPLNSVFTATIAKRGDRWLVTAFHTSANVFQNPVLSVATRRTALWAGLGGGLVGLLLGMASTHLLRRKSARL